MSHLWVPLGDGIDGNTKPLKETLVTPHAQGVVLDIGAGHGHTLDYLDHANVTKYIALEPNTIMHHAIYERARSLGYDGTDKILVLPYGIEQAALIASALQEHDTPAVDTMISVLALCSVPSSSSSPSPSSSGKTTHIDAPTAIRTLITRLLAPGGQFLFIEHVRSPRADVAWWQDMWAPVWRWVMDGCTLGRPTDKWIEGMGEVWEEGKVWTPEGEPEEHLFWRRVGRFVRKSG